jgi:putative transposase
VGNLPTTNGWFTKPVHALAMPDYRRMRIRGASYFFTVALADRSSWLLVERIGELRAAYAATALEHPFRCDAIVILPDHLHAVWTLPEGDDDYPQRWRKLKARFTREVGVETALSKSKAAKREKGIWQRRYWEHVIRDEADFRLHVAYCWGNPVKHGLVARPTEWAFSSIHRDVRARRVDPEWAGVVPDGNFGE